MNSSKNKFTVIDLLNPENDFVSEDQNLHFELIHAHLQPSPFGLEVNHRLLVQVMGKHFGTFLRNREMYFNKFRESQMSSGDFCVDNLN